MRITALLALLLFGCAKPRASSGNAPLAVVADCSAALALFDERVWPSVLQGCSDCHRVGGLSGNTRLVLGEDRDENLRRIAEVAKLTLEGEPLLVKKATAQTAHGGGLRFAPGSAEAQDLAALLVALSAGDASCIAPPPPAPRLVTLADFDSVTARAYLNRLAPTLVGRMLTPAEQTLVRERGGLAIPAVLKSLVSDPALAEGARRFVEQLLSTGGNRDGIDFSLPGNLAAKLVQDERAWSELLTSETCADGIGRYIACDSGAPYGAGVLTTRAFLAGRASRFNLTRASTLMKSFACQTYPLPGELEPRLEKTELIPMFRASTPEEQVDSRAASGFGNGFGCYECHGQFSLHAQLFVRFDRKGRYRQDATGMQDPTGELGNSVSALMASHKVDPVAAANERSRMFGKEVSNLREAALVMAAAPTFLPCQVRFLLNFTVGTSSATAIEPALLTRIANAASDAAREHAPRFSDLTVATFADPVVVSSTMNGGQQQP